MKKYRKKPVVIEAVQLTESTILEAYQFVHGPVKITPTCAGYERWDRYEASVKSKGMGVPTLEDGPDGRAKHVATIGDWIIKGVHGEFYPCKPDIFEKTYEEAETETEKE